MQRRRVLDKEKSVSNALGPTATDNDHVKAKVALMEGVAEKKTEPDPWNIVYGPVIGDLAMVESTIQSELKSDSPAVEELLAHSRSLGGKRLRPALLLLVARSLRHVDQPHLFAAASLEMLHLATLVHDDVLDGSKTRRHKVTVHEKFGDRAGILLGDYLFTHSFSVAGKAGCLVSMQKLAQSSNLVCEGEISQGASASEFDLTEEQYFGIVSRKTGELCAAACGIGAVLSGANDELVSRYEDYGRELGVAFQIIDDVLDLVGDPSKVGKTLGTDLQNRKPTLPVIHALRVLEGRQRDELLELLKAESVDVDAVLEILAGTGSIEYAKERARESAENAARFIASRPESEANASLGAIAKMMVERAR